MEDTVTEVETTEAIEAVEDTVTNIDDMSDAEFETHFDEVGEEDGTVDNDTSDDTSTEPDTNVTLDDRYSTQLGDADGKLDKPVLIKVDGEVMEITTINELRDMAERGTSVTKKFQKLAEDRRQLEAQLAELGQEPKIAESVESEIDIVANEILESNYADDFKSDVSRLPKEAAEVLSTNPQMLKGLSVDYGSGLAQQIMPEVKREMIVKSVDFITAYINVGKRIQQQPQDTHKTKMLKSEPTTNTEKPDNGKSASEIDGMDSASFEKYFNSL